MGPRERTSDGREILGSEALDGLRVPFDGVCWWCRARPATSGEHKFKRTDLARSMAGEDWLLWGDHDGNVREVRGRSGITRDRYNVVKFPKSMCEPCNNQRSKRFDTAYEAYSDFIHRHPRLRAKRGVDFVRIFGPRWEAPVLNVARYYAKHFGCRMTATGIAVPDSIRHFLDGEEDMPDGHMALVTAETVHKMRTSLSISPEFAEADKALTQLNRYVAAAYVGSVGVRYEWQLDGIPDRSQFFHYPHPLINRFADEIAVAEGRTSVRRRRLRGR